MDDFEQYAGTDPQDAPFRDWLRKCNAMLIKKVGLGVFDLPDWTWRDAFEDGATPAQAVAEMREEMEDA